MKPYSSFRFSLPRSIRAQLRDLKLIVKKFRHRNHRGGFFRRSLRALPSQVASGLDNQFISNSTGYPLDSYFRDHKLTLKLIAFYLPQFHAIPENNKWWGEGFTEWTNVRPSKPLFSDHYQPHVPLDLGYYDLLDGKTQAAQINLAKEYGIAGFCFYFYWFNGKTLLEKPVRNYLSDSSLELPFCLCWANENWSRRWDGKDNEILISQRHDDKDDLAFVEHISSYLRDPRYIRVHGKPLLIVYRPALLPDPTATAKRWRKWAVDHGIGDLFLAYTQSFESTPAAHYGFDAAIEFPPNNSPVRDVSPGITGLVDGFKGNIFDFSYLWKRAAEYHREKTRSFIWRSVCPSWDNTARRQERATVFVNSNPDGFYQWIRYAIYDTLFRHSRPDERLVFINAWNEWAEGAHLEPDQRYGYAWLEACRRALNSVSNDIGFNRKIVFLMHDCHPHGAQYLALSLCRRLKELGFSIEILSLDSGSLAGDFERIAPLRFMNALSPIERALLMQGLQRNGFNYLIANTTVCGQLVEEFALREFRILTLVHELPNLIRERQLELSVSNIATYSDKVVFPAELVHQGFRQFTDLPTEKVVIRHQGLVRKNPYLGRTHEAKQLVTERHGLPSDAVLILAVAFLDDRKGPDLLIEALVETRRMSESEVHCLWVGHHDLDTLEVVHRLLRRYDLESCFHLVGFVRDPLEYYAAADIYALTSREDPFPNVVLECLHIGLPVVAFRGLTGCDDCILENGGRLVEPLDCDAFARETINLIATPKAKPPQNDLAVSMHAYALDLCHHLMGTLRVSVVVPNFNYAHLLSKRLASITNQQSPPYEIIILDDASADDSRSVIEAFRSDCDLPTSIILNRDNSGSPFRQWQRGIEKASGDLVWIAEADDLSESTFLCEMVRVFSDPAVVLAYSDSTQIAADGSQLAPNYLEWTRDVGDFWEQSYCIDGLQEIARSLSVKNTIPNASGVLFRRDTLLKALHDAESEIRNLMVAGDWRLYLEILRHGKCAFVAQSLNHHRRHEASVTTRAALNRHALEVEQMQKYAFDILRASNWSDSDLSDVNARAASYLASLRNQFGLNH